MLERKQILEVLNTSDDEELKENLLRLAVVAWMLDSSAPSAEELNDMVQDVIIEEYTAAGRPV